MAIFRKNKKTTEADKDRLARAEEEHNQSKWDELESLVSDQSASTDTSTTLPAETDDNPLSDLLPHDLSETEPESLSSDLKVDMPTNAEFVDVTPSAPNAVAAMATSAHFDSAVRSERTEKAHSSQTEPIGAFMPAPPATNRPDRADIGAMRLDVARISADIQSGEELYRRAQQRIENLTGFVERAEIDFSMLNRLEPENRRLKARNRTIEREIDANVQKMDVLRADLADREQRLSEKTRVYETTLGKLSIAQKSLQEYERALNNTRESSDRNALNSERLQTSLDVERRENQVLRERVANISSDMDIKQNAYIEAKKIADSLAQDCSDFRQQAESAEKDADELRKSLATAQTQNNAMKSELLGLHEDIRTFKSQSEFTIISREDEMTALQLQVEHLTKQLDIKDEIVRNAARDVQELRKIRTAQDLERERLEAEIETQSYQLDQAHSELLKTKQDVTDFDRRYRDVATALSVAQARRQSNQPAESPDIQPLAPTMPTATAAPLASDPLDDLSHLTEDDISDRIMDFRLGIRSDIT